MQLVIDAYMNFSHMVSTTFLNTEWKKKASHSIADRHKYEGRGNQRNDNDDGKTTDQLSTND